MTENKEKIKKLIDSLGGADEVADGLGVTYQAVWQWYGRAGQIPQKYWRGLIAMAVEKGVSLNVSDFVAVEGV